MKNHHNEVIVSFKTMLLAVSSPRLHFLPCLPKTPQIKNPNPNFTPIPLKSSRLLYSHRLFCLNSTRSEDAKISNEAETVVGNPNFEGDRMRIEIGTPCFSGTMGTYRMSLGDQAFFLMAFIACTTSIAFTSLVVAAVPTLYAMKRAATSLAKLADTAREELPSTMTTIRLSGMEISDLTVELSDLSQEIADGVSKSAKAVQAAEAGIKQIGALARSKTISMIEERASLPDISLQPVVVGAAKKTSNAVGRAKNALMNLISRGGDVDSDDKE